MLARQGLIVHLVAQQGLRMQSRRHVERLVIIIRAAHRYESSRRIGTDHRHKIREPRSAKASDDVPAFHAHMARVLPDSGQALNIRQFVLARLLDGAAYSKSPVLEIHSRIIDVVVVDRKFLEWRQLGVTKRRREMPTPKQLLGSPVTEAQAFF
jgi:hypothetical protein